MIALALLLLLLAAAAVVFVLVAGTSQAVTFVFFAGNYQTRPVWIFAGGALALLLAEAGLALFRRGTRRRLAQRREIKRLRQVEQSGGAPASTAQPVPRSGDPAPDPDERLVRQHRPSQDPPADQPAAPATGTAEPAAPATGTAGAAGPATARREDEQPRQS